MNSYLATFICCLIGISAGTYFSGNDLEAWRSAFFILVGVVMGGLVGHYTCPLRKDEL